MAALASLLAVLAIALAAVGLGQAAAGRATLAFLPYGALAVFLAGFCYRVAGWAAAPVPFRIPTTCGQQRSLPWLKASALENPWNLSGVLGRMALEVLAFRSLFRNNRMQLYERRLVIAEDKFLWLAALAFHWSLLVIVLRHLRLLVDPVPGFVLLLERLDGFFQVGTPEVYISDVLLLLALVYLLVRRFRQPQVRHVSLFTDYFALWLILGIGISGALMRYVVRVDVVAAKQFALGIVTFHPALPAALNSMFLVHLLLVAALGVYFPFSKLVHMGGIFLSPTRNLANNNRRKRHINPWNYPVKTHTYAEWETEFREKLVEADIPLETKDAATMSAD